MTKSLPLDILVCPESHQALRYATPEELSKLLEAATKSELKNIGGASINDSFENALIREDGALAYLIQNEIPVLLHSEAVALQE